MIPCFSQLRFLIGRTRIRRSFITPRSLCDVNQPKHNVNFVGNGLPRSRKTYRLLIAGVFCYIAISFLPYYSFFRELTIYRIVKPPACVLRILLIYAPISRKKFESNEKYEEELSQRHADAAQVLYQMCVLLGGLYVKLGQAMTNMNYVLPPEYISTLNNLKNIKKSVPLDMVQEYLQSTVGENYFDFIEDISLQSFASASIGVLYRARLKEDEKREIVMKFKTEAIRWHFEKDVMMSKFFFRTLAKYIPEIKFSFIVEKIEHSLSKEVDFSNEAQNMDRCRRDLSLFPFAYVPQVYHALSSRDMLTMEYIDGKEVQQRCLRPEEYDKKDVLGKIFDIFAYQIFVTGFVHADPHHSNVVVRKKEDLSNEICVLDHGLYANLKEADRIAFASFFVAGVLGDIDKMKTGAKLLGVEDYEILWTIIFQRPFSLSGYDYSQLSKRQLQGIMKKMSKDRVFRISNVLSSIPGELLLVLRNISILIALNRSFGEPVDIYEYFVKWAGSTVQRKRGWFFEVVLNFFYSLYIKFCLVKHRYQRKAIRKIAEQQSIEIGNIEL